MLTGGPLTTQQVAAVARSDARVQLSRDARARMEGSRRFVEEAPGGGAVYGVSTGLGALEDTRIPARQRKHLQQALIRSHAAGVGPPVEREVVRAMMLLRASKLAMGWSGVRPAVVEALAGVLNAGLTPVVPEHGSVGCSGDLAPLAHVALFLTGEAEGAEAALAGAGLQPLVLEAKEGLSLINGTDGMLGMLMLAVEDLSLLLRTADLSAALSIEALLGTDRPFRPQLRALRPHPGIQSSAAAIHQLLAGSGIVASHRESQHAVQDAYSLRCAAQVNGAARDTLDFAAALAAREAASAIDNPVVLEDGELASNGNFHGAPLGLACDFLAIAAAEVAAIAERRLDRLLDETRSRGLPAFLAADPGLDSGLMIAQYSAAALVADNRILVHPASGTSIPTSAMQEDHNSMGWGAARKLRRVLDNVRRVLAIELVCAARGLDLRAPLEPAPATAAARDAVRQVVPGVGPDQELAPQLAAAEALVRSGRLLEPPA